MRPARRVQGGVEALEVPDLQNLPRASPAMRRALPLPRASAASGFSTRQSTPASSSAARDRTVMRASARPRSRSRSRRRARGSRQRACSRPAPRRGAFARARVDVGDGDERQSGQRRVLLGVEAPEVPRRRRRRAEACSTLAAPPRAHRPSSDATIPGRVRRGDQLIALERGCVRPASIASTRAPTSDISRTVSGPTAGTSKRRSCPACSP